MSKQAATLIETLSAQLENFQPLLLPLSSSISPLSSILTHLSSTPLHPIYYPYLRLGILHAIRVSLVWSKLTHPHKSTRKGNIGIIGDLFGFLTLCWGGGTLIALLTNQPPSWLLTPTPLLTYIPIYLLLIPTGMAYYITSVCPSILYVVGGAIIDALTHGTTISTVPTLLKSSGNVMYSSNWWTQAILSGLAITGGGITVQLLGLDKPQPILGTPNALKGGLFNTLEIWAGIISGIIYSTLLKLHPETSGGSTLSSILYSIIPNDLLLPGSSTFSTIPLVTPDNARAITVLLLISLYLFKGLYLYFNTSQIPIGTGVGNSVKKPRQRKLDKVDKEILEAVTHEKIKDVKGAGAAGGGGGGGISRDKAVVEISTPKSRSRASTPRKSGGSKVKTQ